MKCKCALRLALTAFVLTNPLVPNMSTANLACVDTKKIAASNLYLQAKNLDFGIAGHL